jgi:DNA-binding GntR family transcriptional regulator
VDQIAPVKRAVSIETARRRRRWTSSVKSSLQETGQRDARLPKADQVHIALKHAIIRGELTPGAAIDKSALCLRFGISRLPVNTAIHRLAYEGLVRVEPQKGSFVSRIRLDDVLQWMMTRRAIEAEVAAEAARRLSAESCEALARNLGYQEAAVAASDFDGFLELDVAFHRLLTDGLRLDRVAETLEALRVHLDRVRRLLLPEPGRMAATLAEHRAVHAAISAGKAADADRAMRLHIALVTDGLVAFERDHPNFFVP